MLNYEEFAYHSCHCINIFYCFRACNDGTYSLDLANVKLSGINIVLISDRQCLGMYYLVIVAWVWLNTIQWFCTLLYYITQNKPSCIKSLIWVVIFLNILWSLIHALYWEFQHYAHDHFSHQFRWLRSYLSISTDCPYGGLCEQDVKSKANFWGEETGNEVKLHQCPPGYCCPRQFCDPYDECAPNR